MLVVGCLHAVVKRREGDADPVSMETHGEDVTQHHHEPQTGQEGGKTEPEVGFDVGFPKRGRGLCERPTEEEREGRKPGLEQNQTYTRTDDLPVDGVDNGFGQLEPKPAFFFGDGCILVFFHRLWNLICHAAG